MDKELDKLLSSVNKREKKTYQKSDKQSWKKLGISNENGWNARMRKKYFRMIENINKAIINNDMTDISKRPPGVTEKVKGQKGKTNNHADGIWSDSRFDAVKATARQLIKFIIIKDEENRNSANSKTKEVQNVKDIKHYHVTEFLQTKLDNGCSAKTVDQYRTCIAKMAESTVKIGVKSHRRLIREEHYKIAPTLTKEQRTRSKGKTDGEYGYTLEQARKLIDELKYDPYAQTAIQYFTYTSSRFETFMKSRWQDVLENGKIPEIANWSRKDMMKNGRPQLAEMRDIGLRNNLQKIWSTGVFKESDEIWGSRLSRYELEKTVRAACKKAGIDFKGFHAFRSSTLEFYEKEVTPNMSKRELCQSIMRLVNIEVPDKNGDLYKPHNPLVIKKEFKGWKFKSDGTRYPNLVTVTGSDGHPVYEHKFTFEKLMKRRRDFLQNAYVAQILSHNRSDQNSYYRNYGK
ncbi:hypothetical protein [Mesobacillus maritimus]|uniref:hypothetical protein n=1 Tax=Mesobacillus maritimus TaxID=1643336 RepID=UPI00384ECF88